MHPISFTFYGKPKKFNSINFMIDENCVLTFKLSHRKNYKPSYITLLVEFHSLDKDGQNCTPFW